MDCERAGEENERKDELLFDFNDTIVEREVSMVETPVQSAAVKRSILENASKKPSKKKLFHTVRPEDYKNEAEEDMLDSDNERWEEELSKLKIRPTLNRFVYNDKIIDLSSGLLGFEGASILLTNIYNTFVHIVKFKNNLQPVPNRNLAIQLHTIEFELRSLEASKYSNAHLHLPRNVESMFTMLDYRINPIYIDQLKPLSCVLSRSYIAEKISFRSMEATSKNDSNYIELFFNNPFRFIFIGCASRVGQHQKNTVNPFPFFGEYMNTAVDEMYNVLYDMATKEIAKAKDQLTKNSGDTASSGDQQKLIPPANAYTQNSLQSIEAFSNNKQAWSGSSSVTQEKERLNGYLRCVTFPLAKRDNVEFLITSGNSGKKPTAEIVKMKYLVVEKDKEANNKGRVRTIESDVTDDAIYMSSYVRCRVLMLEQPSFSMQIYTKQAIKLMTENYRLVQFDDFDK